MSNLQNFDTQKLIDGWLKQEQEGERFPVDFDIAWQLAGYFDKATGKRRLVSKSSLLVEGEDYKIKKGLFSKTAESLMSGRSSDFIFLTCDSFKQFCLMAKTEQGRQIRQYFIECEKNWRLVQQQQPEVACEIEVLKIKLELAKQEAIAAKAQERTLELRHYVATALPEPVQQKILGYTTIKEIEYRDRILVGDEVVNQGDTVNKTMLCQRYGFLTKSGKPDYKRLNAHLESVDLPSEAWKLTAQIRENQELRKDYLTELDRQMISSSRQLWLGE